MHFDVSIRSKDKLCIIAKNYTFEDGALGEISYLIFIASVICIVPRLRQQFETRKGGGDYHRYTVRTVNAGCM